MKWREVGETCIIRSFITCTLIKMIKSRRMRWAGHVARMGEKRNADRLFVGNPEGKRPHARSRHRLGTILKWILER
jgi:hypothetical protein